MKDSRAAWAFPLALCLLGPFLFLSVIFSVLSPFPTLYLHQGSAERTKSRILALIAVLLGAVICSLVQGATLGMAYGLLVGIPTLILAELLEWKKNPALAVVGSSVATVVLLAVAILIFSKDQPLLSWLREQIIILVQELQRQLAQSSPGPELETKLNEIIANPDLLLRDSFGLILSGIILFMTLPLLLLIRWNPKSVCRRLGIPRDYLRSFSSPEWLVWPAIACVALLIFEVKTLSLIAANLLNPLLLIYFFHGMSILAYFLDSFRLRGPLRYMLYSLGIVFLTPMVVSFGFFDLWFNFRSRIEPSST